jgi:hypothetical protein
MEERGAQNAVFDVSRSDVLAASHGAAGASWRDRLEMELRAATAKAIE